MRRSGSARSGSLAMEWTAACMMFLQVTLCFFFVVFCHVRILSLKVTRLLNVTSIGFDEAR